MRLPIVGGLLFVIVVAAVLSLATLLSDAQESDVLSLALHACNAATAYFASSFRVAVDEPCSIPFMNHTPWCRGSDGPARIALSHLLSKQTSGLDTLAETAGSSSPLIVQLTDTRVAVGDLIPLVKQSHLERREELHVLLEKLADDAKDAARYLQQLQARISVGTDRISAVLGHTSRLLLAAPPPSLTSRPCTLLDFIFPMRDNACMIRPLDRLVVHGTYELALATTEDILRALVMSAQASLGKLEVIDSRLLAIADVALSESPVPDNKEEHVLLQLWTLLGGNRQRYQRSCQDAQVLNDVEKYRKAAVRHVRVVLDTLENMQSMAEEARRLAAGTLLEGKSPDELVLRVISDGTERLKIGRSAE